MDTFGGSIKSDGMTHSSYILLYRRSFLEGVSWSAAQIFCYVMIFYWNFFSKLSHTLKFVLFLPLRRKCCFYYQQLNVPKFRTSVTWIFVGFFSIFDAMISPQTTDRRSRFACERAWRKTTEMLLWAKLCSRSCLSTFLAFTERGRESTLSAFSEWI